MPVSAGRINGLETSKQKPRFGTTGTKTDNNSAHKNKKTLPFLEHLFYNSVRRCNYGS